MQHLFDVRPILVSEDLNLRLKLLEGGASIVAVAALVTSTHTSDHVDTLHVPLIGIRV